MGTGYWVPLEEVVLSTRLPSWKDMAADTERSTIPPWLRVFLGKWVEGVKAMGWAERRTSGIVDRYGIYPLTYLKAPPSYSCLLSISNRIYNNSYIKYVFVLFFTRQSIICRSLFPTIPSILYFGLQGTKVRNNGTPDVIGKEGVRDTVHLFCLVQ